MCSGNRNVLGMGMFWELVLATAMTPSLTVTTLDLCPYPLSPLKPIFSRKIRCCASLQIPVELHLLSQDVVS